jgi:serine protease Do
VAAEIIADLREHGIVRRGWLGVQIQPVTEDIAGALGLDGPGGAIVVRPLPDSPALAAGLRTQDVILAINGTAVANSRELARAIGNLDPDAEVRLTLIRAGERMEMSVTLAAMPNDAVRMAAAPDAPAPSPNGLGLGLAETRNGAVVIADLDPNGTAAVAGLREGDRIAAIGNIDVNDVGDVRTAVDEARSAGRDTVLFQIERNGQTALVAVPLS